MKLFSIAALFATAQAEIQCTTNQDTVQCVSTLEAEETNAGMI